MALAGMRPRWGRAWFTRAESAVAAIGERRLLCAALLFFFPIAMRLALVAVYPAPLPFISDEYAYLLQADTFASGRWTNPAPPSAESFSSVYILTLPTYTAEYQVGQGLMLALGQVVTGVPWAGTVLSMGLLCALVYWAVLAWLPPVWAFCGTFLAVDLGLGVLSYWMNSYWGGCVPAIGGALALGALARLRRHPSAWLATLAALGLFILWNSRPLEGILLAGIATGALLYWTFMAKQLPADLFFRRMLPPLVAGLVVAGAFSLYYDRQVTGRATDLPYMLYRAEYGVPQGFFWQKAVPMPRALPADIQSEYEDQLRQHERRNSIKGLLGATGGKLRRFWEFYIGVPLTVALLFLPFRGSRPGIAPLALWALFAVLVVDNLLFFAYFPHYSAAVLAPLVLVLTEAIRRMRASGEAGLFLSRMLPLVCVWGLLFPMCGRLVEGALPGGWAGVKRLWDSEFLHEISRERFTPELERQAGKQLVLVHYQPYDGERKREWIFNRANLEAAKVVWARDSDDPAVVRHLEEVFPGRTVWRAEPDAKPPRIERYRSPSPLKSDLQ